MRRAAMGSGVLVLVLLAAAPAAAQRGSALSAPEGYGAEADESQVELDVVHRPGERGVRIYTRREGGGVDGPLCTTPCTLRLFEGSYELDVAPIRGRPHVAEGGPFRVGRTRSVIVAHYDDRSAIRVAGWILFTLATHTIAAGLITPAIEAGSFGGGFGTALSLIISIPLGVAIGLIALPMLALEDSVTAVQHSPREALQ